MDNMRIEQHISVVNQIPVYAQKDDKHHNIQAAQ
jgi:hypothetical protein